MNESTVAAWKYKVLMLISDRLTAGEETIELLEHELNRIGATGWELAAMLDRGEGERVAIFKQPDGLAAPAPTRT